jgi:hypothetical protein
VLRIVAERRPQTFHRGVQAVLEVHERAVGPEPPPQFLAGDDPTRTLEHHAKDFEGLFLQANGSGAAPQLPRAHVELKRAEAQGLDAS